MTLSAPNDLPLLEECLDIYANIYQHYDESEFRVEKFLDQIQTTNNEDIELSKDKISRKLDLLVAYGLLDYCQNNKYKIRCSPDETIESWQSKAISRIERLYAAAEQEGLLTKNIMNVSFNGETLLYDGDTFVRVPLADKIDYRTLMNRIKEALKEHRERDGIVLTSPGDLSGEVQQYVDKICNASDIQSFEFEKVMTDLVGDEKDDLEFRAYLKIKE